METFQPGAAVLCCGADSLSGDRVGCWNLSIRGHAACLEHMKTFNVPLLVLGGGGYTIRNVARCWAFETAVICNQQVADDVPWHEYNDYYAPEYKLHVPCSNMENDNSRESLDRTTQKIMETLRQLEFAPNVQVQTGQPGTRQNPDPLFTGDSDADDDDTNAVRSDARPTRGKRCHLAEYYDDDGDEDRLDAGKFGQEFQEPPSDDDAL